MDFLAIDFGTKYIRAAYWDKNKKKAIRIRFGDSERLPAYVAFPKTQYGTRERLIGEEAKDLVKTETNTFFDFKRIIGRRWDDPYVQIAAKRWSYELIPESTDEGQKDEKYFIPHFKLTGINGQQGNALVRIKSSYSAIECTSMLFRKVKEIATKQLGFDIKHTTITIPTWFGMAQRAAILKAAELAGFEQRTITNDAIALATAHLETLKNDSEHKILVFDIGGGLLESTLIHVKPKNNELDVLQTKGVDLGGIDFDEVLMRYFYEQFEAKTNQSCQRAGHQKKASDRLRLLSEEIKISLSTQNSTTRQLDAIVPQSDCECKINREVFEKLSKKLFKESMKCVLETIKNTEDITTILVAGGGTHLPRMKSLLKRCLKQEPTMVFMKEFQLVEQAAKLSREGKITSHLRLPSTLTIETDKSLSPLIKKQSLYPTVETYPFTTYTDDQESLCLTLYETDLCHRSSPAFLGHYHFKMKEVGKAGTLKTVINFNVSIDGVITLSSDAALVSIKGTINPIDSKLPEMMHHLMELDERDEDISEKLNLISSIEDEVVLAEDRSEDCSSQKKWLDELSLNNTQLSEIESILDSFQKK